MRKALTSASLAAATMALSAAPALAQILNIAPGGEFNTLGRVTIPIIVAALVRIVLIVAAIIFFFMLVLGGIQWMTSGGDKAAAEAARGRVTAALIGLVVVFAAYAIIALVGGMFGVNVLQFNLPRFYP